MTQWLNRSIILMIIPILPKKHRKRPPKVRKPSTTPGPVALTLVSASFIAPPMPPGLVLTFDRAINVEGVVGSEFQVDDDVFTGNQYVGDPDGAGVGGATMSLVLDVAGSASGGQVLLTVGAANGIVAVDDGGTWAGVTDLVLPFP